MLESFQFRRIVTVMPLIDIDTSPLFLEIASTERIYIFYYALRQKESNVNVLSILFRPRSREKTSVTLRRVFISEYSRTLSTKSAR